MSDKTYDRIKNAALLIAPVLGFAAAIATIWEVPNAAMITATITAIDTMLGGIVVAAKKIHDKVEE